MTEENLNHLKSLSFKIRPRAIQRLIDGKRLTRSMSGVIYRKYIKSQDWKIKKEKYKKNHCEICGVNNLLDLHHLSYKNLLFEEEKDLATLCRYCHFACHVNFAYQKGVRTKSPSSAISRIVNMIRNGNKLKPTAFALFLRRRWIAKYTDSGLPEFRFFRQFFNKNIKGNEYPFGYSIYKL